MKREIAASFLAPKQERFVVPLTILQIVAREQFFDEFQLFIYLKSISDGGLVMNRTVLRSAAHYLDCHPKTVKRRLERLRERNWIGRFKCGVLILRSFNTLFRVENVRAYRTAVVFRIEYLKNFTAFVVSACIGYLAISQKSRLYKQRKTRRPGTKSGVPIPTKRVFPVFLPVACKYIAEIFGVAISTASEWKQLGVKAGFLNVEKQFEYVDIDNRLEYKRQGMGDDHLIVYRRGKYYRQGIDLVASLLTFKSRKKPSLLKSGQMPKHNIWIEGGGPLSGNTQSYYEAIMKNRHNK